jgi:hypothetical protein
VSTGRQRRVVVLVRRRGRSIRFRASESFVARATDMWMLGDSRDLIGNLLWREHGVHATSSDSAAGHRVVARGVVLRKRDAAFSLDRLQTQRAVCRRAGENDPDRQRALIGGQSLEKEIDRPVRRAGLRSRTQCQHAAINAKICVARNHVDVIRLDGEPVRDLLNGHRRGAAQKLGQRTLMLRVEVLDEHEAHAGVDWQARKQRRERLEPTG